MSEVAFPEPRPDDGEDVGWALETASALWARGDAREAIRWIRRAAETAGDKGNDSRAVDLARAAADLATELKIPPSMPPPPMESTSASVVATMPGGGEPSAPKKKGPRRRGSLTRTAVSHNPDFEGRDRRPAPEVGVEAQNPPPSFEAPSVTDPNPTIREDIDEPTVRTDFPEALKARLDPKSSTNVRTRQALRVSVIPSLEDRALLTVRVLGEDEVPPDGAHEAMLVAVEAGAHLLARKR